MVKEERHRVAPPANKNSKNALFDRISIKRLLLCVKAKAISSYADMVVIPFWRML
jgi:hypothetical protein